MTNEIFFLKSFECWKDYVKNETNMVDVTIACDDGQKIQAHRIILSAGSLFFRNIFTTFKHPHSFIFLSGIRKRDLLNAIEFLYNGEIKMSKGELKNFLDVAHKLQIQGIGNTDIRQTEINDDDNFSNSTINSDSMRKMDGGLSLEDELSEGEHTKKTEECFRADKILKKEQDNEKVNDDDNDIDIDFQKKETYGMEINTLPDQDIGDLLNEKVEKYVEKLSNQDHQHRGTNQYNLPPSTEELLRENVKDDNNMIAELERIDDLWECKYCGKSFVKKNHAKSHVEIHMKNVLYSCQICNKTFRTKDSFRVHSRNAHTDETFVCTMCGKSGMSRMAFKNHKYQSRCAKRKIQAGAELDQTQISS